MRQPRQPHNTVIMCLADLGSKVVMADRSEALGETLTRQYRLSCELFNTFPEPHITRQLSRGSLELHLHTVDVDQLEALCHTIKNKVSLSYLRIYVPMDKEVVARVVERAVEGAAVCVVASLTLTALTLEGVRLRGRTLKLLCEGVRKARTLKTLHLWKCALGNSGTESVCQAVKNVPSITHLSLSDCGVEERGAAAIASLIKHQRLNRDSAMWQDTLRQRQPYLDGMKGLRRLTLNSNPALGDHGAAAIAEVLAEDLWIKAVDLQHCGLGAGGGASLCALLHANQTLEVVDVRNNPFLPDKVHGELMGLLQGRQTEDDAQYTWLKTSQVEDEAVERQQKGETTVGYRASGRVGKGRRPRQPPRRPTSSRGRPKVPSQLGVPWRVEHRLYERREGLAPGSMVKERFGKQQQSDEATAQPFRESVSEGEVSVMKMRRKLHHYRRKYQKEHERRQRLERKLSRIQTQLKGLHTVDEDTMTHIEECFLKFQIFLSMMHNSGEHLQSSSSSAASPVPRPTEPGSSHTPQGLSLPPGAFFPNPPSTIPLPVLIRQSFTEATVVNQPGLASSFASMHGKKQDAKNTAHGREISSQDRNGAVNFNHFIDERNPASQGHSHHGKYGERLKEDSCNLEGIASQQHINGLPVSIAHDVLEGRRSRDEAMMKQQLMTKTMLNEVHKGKQMGDGMRSSSEENDYVPPSESRPHYALEDRNSKGREMMKQKQMKKMSNEVHMSRHLKDGMRSSGEENDQNNLVALPSRSMKQKQTVGTQVTNDILEWDITELKKNAGNPKTVSLNNVDSITMRVEVGDPHESFKTGKIRHANKKDSHNVTENREHELRDQSGSLSLQQGKVMKETRTQKDQKHLETYSPEEMKLALEGDLPTTRRADEMNFQSRNISLQKSKVVKETHTQKDQRHLNASSPEDMKLVQDDLPTTRRPGLEAYQSPKESQSQQSSQSFSASQLLQFRHSHETSQSPENSPKSPSLQPNQPVEAIQSYSSQSLYERESAEESQLLLPQSPRKSLPQMDQSYEGGQSSRRQSLSSQSIQSQSSPRQSPHSQSPRKSPQLIRPYEESQLLRRQSLESQSAQSQSPLSQSPHSQSPRSPPPHSQSPHSRSPHGQPSHSPLPYSPPPHSQLPRIQLPSSHSPQESHSLKKTEKQLSPKVTAAHSPLKKTPPNPPAPHSPLKQPPPTVEVSPSLHEIHVSEDHLSPKKKSPKKQSPRKSRSPREEWGGEIQASEVSETDDEKMRNLSAWLHGRMRGRASTPTSSSSVSISEQLQQSHSSWTKGRNHRRQRAEGKEAEEVHGESEFEFDASDLDDLSISGITLTNTSVPEEMHTPGEEDF